MLAFRVDASHDIGSGHVMRCLALADVMRRQGRDSHFICKEYVGNLIELIRQRNYTVSVLPRAYDDYSAATILKNGFIFSKYAKMLGDWKVDSALTCKIIEMKKIDQLIIDHYGIDKNWEFSVRQSKLNKIIVIDDLANRSHICDMLIDQNFGREIEHYKGLVPENCNILTGTKYAILREEFSSWRTLSINARQKRTPSKVMISMGGVDVDNVTLRIIRALESYCGDINLKEIYVVLGAGSPHLNLISNVIKNSKLNIRLLNNINNMAEFLARCDFVIGAGGTSAWERACLGVPSVIFSIAENQKFSCEQLAQFKAVIYLDDVERVDVSLPEALKFICQPENLIKMQNHNQLICDGFGANRVVDEIFRVA